MIKVNDFLSIPDDEVWFTASLSSGPGGQNVNKVNSRVTLRFNVVDSPSLTQQQKELIMRRLGSRMSREGVLRVISQGTRSQTANREAALARLVDLLQAALRQDKPRKKTCLSTTAHMRRLEDKMRRSFLKRRRSSRVPIPSAGDDSD